MRKRSKLLLPDERFLWIVCADLISRLKFRAMPAKDEKSTTAQKVEKSDLSEKKPKGAENKEKDKKQSEDNQFEDDDDFEEFPVNTPGDTQLPPEFETEDVVSE